MFSLIRQPRMVKIDNLVDLHFGSRNTTSNLQLVHSVLCAATLPGASNWLACQHLCEIVGSNGLRRDGFKVRVDRIKLASTIGRSKNSKSEKIPFDGRRQSRMIEDNWCD